ncbi:MAG: menaquinone biosynthetic enzyme MqnA/MqnD family protein [Bryobacteraceae bacterium]
MPSSSSKPRVCAVSYLNTVPLVWGMLHGSQRDIFDLSFALPSVCADRLAAGEADIGIVPVIEMARQKLAWFRGTGIACHGPVRSILMISKIPFCEIQTLATDSGSRTSVMISRVILARKFGVEPRLISRAADLAIMLGEADAALLIGDAALRIDPAATPFQTLDLGAEWVEMTGLPMVFAVWAGPENVIEQRYERVFVDSCRFGLAQMDQIAESQASVFGFPRQIVRKYLTENIVFELGERDYQGLDLFLQECARFEALPATQGASR